MIPDNFNYDAAINNRKDLIAQLQVKLDWSNAQVDKIMAFITDNVPCESVEAVVAKNKAYLKPHQNTIKAINEAMSQIKEQIDELTCRKNFQPPSNSEAAAYANLHRCLIGDKETKKDKDLQGKSGSNGRDGEKGRKASKIDRMQKLLDCQANGANGSRGAAGKR